MTVIEEGVTVGAQCNSPSVYQYATSSLTLQCVFKMVILTGFVQLLVMEAVALLHYPVGQAQSLSEMNTFQTVAQLKM